MSLWSFWILLQRRNTEGVKLSQNTWQRGESYTFSTKKQNLILLFKRLGSGRTRNTNQLLFPAYIEMATTETVRKELLPCRNWLKEPETKNVKWNVKYRSPTRRGYVAKATWHSKTRDGSRVSQNPFHALYNSPDITVNIHTNQEWHLLWQKNR